MTFDKIRGILEYCIELLSLSIDSILSMVSLGVCPRGWGPQTPPSVLFKYACHDYLRSYSTVYFQLGTILVSQATPFAERKEGCGHLIVWPDNLVML